MANTSDVTAMSGDLSVAVRAASTTAISGLFASAILLGLAGVWSGNKQNIEGLGDPAQTTVLTAAKIPPAIVKEIGQCASWSPFEHSIKQIDGKSMGVRDTSPTISAGSGATLVANLTSGAITSVTVSAGGTYTGSPPTLNIVDATGKGAILLPVMSGGAIASVTILSGGYNYTSPDIIVQAGASSGERYGTSPVFKWWQRKDTGEIFHEDIKTFQEKARNAVEFRKMTASLVQSAMQETMSGQVEMIGHMYWFGMPTDQTATKWDQPIGILNAVDDSNTYAGVDRSLTGNYWWQSKVERNSLTLTGAQLVENARYVKGLADKGGNCHVVLCGQDLFMKYSAEARAMNQRVEDSKDDRMRMLAAYGYEGDIIKISGAYFVYDWRCPPKTAITLDMRALIFAFKTGEKFQAEGPHDQTKVKGGDDADIFYLNTKSMPMLVAPWWACKYTALS